MTARAHNFDKNQEAVKSPVSGPKLFEWYVSQVRGIIAFLRPESMIEAANAYLEKEYLSSWNQALTVQPAEAGDAHRPLGKEQDLAAILSHVEQRQVTNDYTVHYNGKVYQIDRRDIRV